MRPSTVSRSAREQRRGEGRPRVAWAMAAGPPCSNRRLRRRTWRTVSPRAAATWALVNRPPHSAFNNPGRCSSFRLNVKVSIEGGPFHGAVRGGHFHVAAAASAGWLDRAASATYGAGATASHASIDAPGGTLRGGI